MGHQDPQLSIAHVDAERGFSGGEIQVFLLMEGLRRRGHRNLLICQPGSQSAAEAGRRGFEICALPMRADLDLVGLFQLRRALQQAKPDLVHLHTGRATWLGGLAAAWCGLPALTTRRQDRRVKRNWRTRLIYRRLVRRVVAISEAVAACLLAGGVDPLRIEVIPSSVDPEGLRSPQSRQALRQASALAEESMLLLVMAALVPRKGLDVLLEALGRLIERGDSSTRLWIAGEGPERPALEARSLELKLSQRVSFLGRRVDKAELLAQCDVFVLPSRREGLGVAALEAMAAARPVIASAVGGLAQAVIDGQTGLLVEPGNVEQLVQAIARLRDDRELAGRLGGAGPARVARGHLPDQMVEAYLELYARLMKEERS